MRATTLTSIDAATGTVNGFELNANQGFACSLQAIGTGTLAGTLKLQYSNDPSELKSPAPTNWTDSGLTVALTAGSIVIIPKTDICYNWVRAVFTASGGAGTVTARIKMNGY